MMKGLGHHLAPCTDFRRLEIGAELSLLDKNAASDVHVAIGAIAE